ncbi:MAG: hypothetical protein DSY58_00375 [Desulfobulbus sp.]|nr:MAG: hypothetical protein DSY58_00375 [Desulfobulbus sp.]RUM41876.1 MAG: hypothetical protein DSY70_00435 [Desulfobulbus sp.]
MDSENIPAKKKKPVKTDKFFPGCFKKSTAFFLDQIVIALLGMGLFYPFSGFMSSLSVHAWLPGYLIGALYYMVMESSLFRSASLAKMAFSMEVRTAGGEKISPFVSLARYICITLPFYNNAVSRSIATTIGVTNTSVGGTAFLVVVGLLFVGNTLFMVLHPQKRGLHDLLFNTVVVPARAEQVPQILSLTKKSTLGGIVGLLILGLVFGNMYLQQGKNPEFAGIEILNTKLQKLSGLENLTVSYRKFVVHDKITVFSADVHVPLSFEQFGDSSYTESLAKKLFPMVKKLNTNPKVDTVTIVFHTQKFIGAFPISKYTSSSQEIAKIESE